MIDKDMNFKKKSLQNQIKVFKKNENKFAAYHLKMDLSQERSTIELKQRDSLLDRIFSNTHILIAYLDCSFNFVYVNRSYADYNKKSVNYYLGKNYFEVYSGEKYREIFSTVVESGLPYIVYQKQFSNYQILEKNDLYWDWSLYPVKIEQGIVDGLILTFLDVTERVKYKGELEETKDQLIKSKRLSDLGMLAATVAHELRNPLSVIQAAIYNIDRKKQNLPIDNQIQTIEKKILESEQIISNLLAYAKIKMPVLTLTDISETIDDSINTVLLMFKTDNIEIVKNYIDLIDMIIMVDRVQIKEVFCNVLINAFQSIKRKKSVVVISIQRTSSCLRIDIEDNGDGIKKADIAKVFEPFFTRKSRGTGLGLSLCREIVNLHSGSIDIQSKLGKGSVVSICLPYQDGKI